MTAPEQRTPAGLRTVALLEFSKGLLVLVAGFGLLSLLHRDLEQGALELVRLFHLNPASHIPAIFIEAVARLTDARLWGLAAAGLGYALLRFAEGWGLWRQRPWAEWMGAVTGGVYIPIELYELYERVTWARAGLFAVNVAVVGYLAAALVRARRKPGR